MREYCLLCIVSVWSGESVAAALMYFVLFAICQYVSFSYSVGLALLIGGIVTLAKRTSS